ncbi:hypothetical protein C2S51_032873 [Perilla frutescens var. frutescens]|nr:hypothetical protein C2S51_032873 [Perilla frutescens var. frutescens]
MEKFPSDSELRNVVRELSEGKELAKQLQHHLNLQSSSSSHESREFLLQRILYSYDHALSMLTHGEGPPPPPTTDSPRSLAGSPPHSDDSDQDLASRKRKTVARWSEKVKVSPESGIEGQLDDGYGWRKYGQKDILGAKYPRGYYRCTYRHTYGCLATKQVQRSDEDPTSFEITYRRKHTCNRANPLDNTPLTIPDPQNEDPNQQNEPAAFNIQTSLKVITPPDPFNFPSSSAIINPQTDHIFSDHNDALGNYYPIRINDNYGELIPNLLHNADSELSPIVAAMTSTTNTTTLDTADFPFGPSGFGSGFDFGNSGHYP